MGWRYRRAGRNQHRQGANRKLGAAEPGICPGPATAKSGNVYAIYHGGARTLSDFIYGRYIAKALYPDAFADVDPDAEIKAYYKAWLPIEAQGVYVLALDPAQE